MKLAANPLDTGPIHALVCGQQRCGREVAATLPIKRALLVARDSNCIILCLPEMVPRILGMAQTSCHCPISVIRALTRWSGGATLWYWCTGRTPRVHLRCGVHQTYLSSGNFAPLHSTAGKPFSLPRYTWRPFAILKALGLSVAAYDENLGPAGSDLDRYDLPRYHRDPRASHRRHR